MEIDNSLRLNNSKKAFAAVKQLTERKRSRPTGIEDQYGKLLTTGADIADRWKTYCTELYNYKAKIGVDIIKEDVEGSGNSEDEEVTILKSEVEDVIKELKNYKSPGADNICAELIKNGGEDTVKLLQLLCNKILETSEWPSQWTESILIPLAKKANIKKCTDFRTISLISHASKVLLKIIQKRITPRVEAVLDESQAGFRKGGGTDYKS